MRLAWSPLALDDLKSAIDYIEFELDSPMAAQRLYESVLEKVQLFADAPGAAMVLRTIRGIDTGYRYVTCGNWMIFLMADKEQVLVVRILYGKSDYMRAFFGEFE